MGYNASSSEVKVRIQQPFVGTALAALHEFARKRIAAGKPRLSWSDWNAVLAQTDLRDALAELMWETTYDAEGNLVFRCFSGEKVGDDEHIGLNVIAPFVDPDSVIVMVGQDGYQWRYRFYGYNACIDGRVPMVEEEMVPSWQIRRRNEQPTEEERAESRAWLRERLSPEYRKLLGIDP